MHSLLYVLLALLSPRWDRESYGNEAKTTPSTGDNSQVSSELISKYARFIYSCHGVDLGPTKTRVVLCHIYHHAIHDQWFQARDLMLMTHLQEGIGVADINTQVRVRNQCY